VQSGIIFSWCLQITGFPGLSLCAAVNTSGFARPENYIKWTFHADPSRIHFNDGILIQGVEIPVLRADL
jgi:hypothetical protein